MRRLNQTGDSYGPRSLRLDPLTGLDNLFAFIEFAGASVERAQAADSPIGFLAADLEQFKMINDEYGHAAGDHCLSYWARELQRVVMQLAPLPSDVRTRSRVFRSGGDEFIIVLPGATEQDLRGTARGIRAAHPPTLPGTGRVIPTTLTLSDAVLPADGETLADALLAIDRRLLAAKRRRARARAPGRRSALPMPSRAPVYLVGRLVEAVRDTLVLLDEAQKMAFTDVVTGLPNQRACLAVVQRELARAGDLETPCAALIVDGDDLKTYNDRLDHEQGDRMIRRLGEVLLRNVRPGDHVARWRVGDEFAVVLPGCDLPAAQVVAERLRSEVARASRGWPLPISVTVGIAAHPADAGDALELLRCAEAATYLGKREGKNQVRTYRDVLAEEGRAQGEAL